MKVKTKILLSTAVFLSFSIASAGLYRWVDDKGEVHFSDKVPVAASKKVHTKIDKSGISQRELDPEAKIKRQQELEKIALAKAEEEKINKKIRAERAKIHKRDRYLLSTYENKAELVKSFRTKIKMLKGNSAILLAHKERLEKKLLALKTNGLEPEKTTTVNVLPQSTVSNDSVNGLEELLGLNNVTKKVKKVKKKKHASLDDQIVNIESTIKQYEKVLLENDKELVSLNDDFNVDLKRYLDLTK